MKNLKKIFIVYEGLVNVVGISFGKIFFIVYVKFYMF